ncbi:Spondin-1 [Orchesella cincta]|uniref:Spondin-1 n=1 Tax=Orchesella cincta TaxID=48709 RepID=A0A1D2MRJ2_ORCCI|nr:Spondin-1 [Orchesella cincta]
MQIFDCHVSSWGSWSPCDVDCGNGVMTRTRAIIQEPRNGGKPCPSLMQKRGCLGTSSRRRATEGSDITRNLRLRYLKNSDKERAKPKSVDKISSNTGADLISHDEEAIHEYVHACKGNLIWDGVPLLF